MKESSYLPIYGAPTKREIELIHYLGNCIADRAEAVGIERRELIAALTEMCKLVFCHQTHCNIEEQCDEIDLFCSFLKDYARTNK